MTTMLAVHGSPTRFPSLCPDRSTWSSRSPPRIGRSPVTGASGTHPGVVYDPTPPEVHQPRARHSGIDGRSLPRVVSSPCPGYTQVSSGSVAEHPLLQIVHQAR